MKIKPRSDAVIPALTPDRRDLLESWLFDENLSYKAAAARGKRLWSITIDDSAIGRHYRQTAHRRNLERIARSAQHANSVVKVLEKNPGDTYRAIVGIAGQYAFQTAVDPEHPPDARILRDLIQLLNTAREELRAEAKFAFDREKWEFDITEACMEKLPDLKVISTNPTISHTEKMRLIRLKLFGSAPD